MDDSCSDTGSVANRSRTRCGAKHPGPLYSEGQSNRASIPVLAETALPCREPDTRLKDANSFCTAIFGKLKAETALANASLSDDAYHTTFALDRIFEFLQQSGEFIVSAGAAGLTVIPLRKTPLEGAC